MRLQLVSLKAIREVLSVDLWRLYNSLYAVIPDKHYSTGWVSVITPWFILNSDCVIVFHILVNLGKYLRTYF